jgi:hypothetical protein
VKGTQTITFVPPAAATFGDQPFTVSATGGSSGNPVTFAASGACASSGANGSTITIVTAGACTITASQAGSDLYDAASDVTGTVPIAKAASAFSALDAPAIEGGAAATISGTVGAGLLVPTGSVSISVGGVGATAMIGVDGRFTASVPTGALPVSGSPYVVGFTYGGDANFAMATGSSSLQVVDTTSPSISGVSTSQVFTKVKGDRIVDLTVSYQASDFSGSVCALTVTPVSSADRIEWRVIGAHGVQFFGKIGNGGNKSPIYRIGISCSDPSTNTSATSTAVTLLAPDR